MGRDWDRREASCVFRSLRPPARHVSFLSRHPSSLSILFIPSSSSLSPKKAYGRRPHLSRVPLRLKDCYRCIYVGGSSGRVVCGRRKAIYRRMNDGTSGFPTAKHLTPDSRMSRSAVSSSFSHRRLQTPISAPFCLFRGRPRQATEDDALTARVALPR
ncbi:hypothetical protein B0H19DRAFT_1255282 [Mycena capillaripes]|nr:hypothetical protein B0H19DRAFT_1255282 [Mycena capillaripes]